MSTAGPLRFALTATLRPARSIVPLVGGGLFAAHVLARGLGIEDELTKGHNDRAFEYQRLFVSRMLSRYLQELPLQPRDSNLEHQRYEAARVLLPLIDYFHGLPSPDDSFVRFEALDRQWRYEREWVRSGREGTPMMEAMLVLSEASRLARSGQAHVPLPYAQFPFETFEHFAQAVPAEAIEDAWNPVESIAVIGALNDGEQYMLEETRKALAQLDDGD